VSLPLVTIADYIRLAYSRMAESGVYCGHGTDNIWDEAVSLVLQSLYLPWDFDAALWQCRLTDQESALLADRIDRRVNDRTPLAYLTNRAWFCGTEFYVDERVLVPRSPISELIQNDFQPWLKQAPGRVLDLCTGSGCIGFAIALQYPHAHVDLVDISEDALAVALINQARQGLEGRTRLIQSDLFASLNGDDNARYDLIVSNPPYVNRQDLDSMPEEYHREPRLGLEAGHDGLALVRRILKESGQFLKPDGLLIVELGNSWVDLEEAYPDVPFTWLEFEHGGHGVFCLHANEIHQRDW